MRFGERSISMDDIAKESIVSKKTIYQHFENKESLLLTIVKNEIAEWDTFKAELAARKESAVIKIYRYNEFVKTRILNFNPLFIIQVSKYYRAIETEINTAADSNQTFIEGLYRELKRSNLLNDWVDISSAVKVQRVLNKLFIENCALDKKNAVNAHLHLIQSNFFGMLTTSACEELHHFMSRN